MRRSFLRAGDHRGAPRSLGRLGAGAAAWVVLGMAFGLVGSACIGPKDLVPFPAPTVDGCLDGTVLVEGQCWTCAKLADVDAARYCEPLPGGEPCDPNCTRPRCGNGYQSAGEACDDGNNDDCEGPCRGDCSAPVTGCGDGVACGLEACDDGNNDDCDGCRADCSAEETGCGDGFVCGDEDCDDQNTDECDTCGSDCKVREPTCGDGIRCGNEVCDDGNTSDCEGTCRGDCAAQVTGCGDGLTCGDEACDDGNTSDCDGCRSDCKAVETGCGDGFVCGSEACDDGNTTEHDGCEPTCQLYDYDWARWPMPNSPGSGLPNQASVDVEPASGVVTDLVTGLVWQREALEELDWEGAKTYCDGLQVGAFSDWRLPSLIELVSVVDYSKNNLALDLSAFLGPAVSPTYWTASSYGPNPANAWTIDFTVGLPKPRSKAEVRWVRCVR